MDGKSQREDGWVSEVSVKKLIRFWQKHVPTRGFYGSPHPPTSLGPDRWLRREGYGGPSLGEKRFQLFSIFIVYIYRCNVKEEAILV